jgi:hypothetical protein
MNSVSVWHWIIVLIVIAVFLVPAWRILSKAGYSGAWSLLYLVPVVNIIALWVFAFADWPATQTRESVVKGMQGP